MSTSLPPSPTEIAWTGSRSYFINFYEILIILGGLISSSRSVDVEGHGILGYVLYPWATKPSVVSWHWAPSQNSRGATFLLCSERGIERQGEGEIEGMTERIG